MADYIEVKETLRLYRPAMPSFIKRSDDANVDIADLSDATLRALGAAWTEELVLQAAKRRQHRRDEAEQSRQLSNVVRPRHAS